MLGLVHAQVTLNFLATFGLGMLFLMAGFEMDPAVFKGRPIRNALTGWALSAVIAFGAAMLLTSAGLASGWLLTGLALATSSIGALLPVLRNSGLLSPPYGPMVLAAGAIGEAAPVIVLSLVLAQGRAPMIVSGARAPFSIAGVAMLVLPKARGFELSLCSTLMTTRRAVFDELRY